MTNRNEVIFEREGTFNSGTLKITLVDGFVDFDWTVEDRRRHESFIESGKLHNGVRISQEEMDGLVERYVKHKTMADTADALLRVVDAFRKDGGLCNPKDVDLVYLTTINSGGQALFRDMWLVTTWYNGKVPCMMIHLVGRTNAEDTFLIYQRETFDGDLVWERASLIGRNDNG